MVLIDAQGICFSYEATLILQDISLAVAQGMHVICADSTGVRWATGLQNRVSLPPARGP